MSTSRGLGQNGGHFYSNITKPVKIDLNFIVDSTNGNGLGIRSLKSNGYVRNVFMHTSASPGSNDGALNPNPASGYALIQFKNNFNSYLGGFSGFVSPTTGSPTGSIVNHSVYIIATLGSTSAAQWLAKGVPAGVTPAVGVPFVAIATGALGGSGTVIAAGSSGISSVEVVGDTALTANSNIGANGGMYLLVQFLGQVATLGAYTPSGTVAAPVLTMNSYTPAGTNDGASPPIFTGTPATLTGTNSAPAFTGAAASLTGTVALSATAPANGATVGMSAFFDASSVTIDGL